MSAHVAGHALRAAARPDLWRNIADRWLNRIRDRAAMATMTERDMRDAGLNRYDVARECSKPFWRE
ncbi:DUF1127 domain-containing protein [Neoroseomonas soli]|uniref:Translation initiation factor IF-2 n=1 Tax=Neoroseomonas soli TaxID=1081025 RepID=A0A9X9WZG3_9PROT|nr:hypothetical protein [Neoroseomonas soli]MBR0672542.1 translation initiation factor IF-2 [Neoroseomonas soli]